MATSQNGWPASADREVIGVDRNFSRADVTFPSGVRSGDVSVVLGYVADQFHHRVENLVPGWCWGYHYREVRESTGLSNHASGTAIDINAPEHPLGAVGTFTADQVATIRAILREVDGVIRWGGDYSGRKDEMHFEVNASSAAVAAVAKQLTAPKNTPAKPALKPTPAPIPIPLEEDEVKTYFAKGKTDPAIWCFSLDGSQLTGRHVALPEWKLALAAKNEAILLEQADFDALVAAAQEAASS